MRLFVAVYPPPEALAGLGQALSEVDIKLGEPGRWHITLAFIGDVPDAARAGAAVADMTMNPVGPLRIQGGGRYGSLLWAGVQGDLAALTRLTRSLKRSLRAQRVPVDEKKFSPHITLARRVKPEGLAAALQALRDYEGPEWTPREVALVSSELGPNPVHETLFRSEIPLS